MSRRSNGGRARPALEQLEVRETPAAVGALDPSFGVGGVARTAFTGDSAAQAVVVQPDGKVVVVGTSAASGSSDFAVARYNPDGSPDASFDGDGKVTVDFGGLDQAFAVALQPDGKIVVAGFTNLGGTAANPLDFAVVRLNPDGGLDTTFDGDGKATVDFGANDRASGVVVQADGKIVAVGLTDPGGPAGPAADFAAVRLNPDGGLDTTFDGDGKATVDFGGSAAANAVALRPDGRLVLAGVTSPDGLAGQDFAVARVNPDGSLDAAFDGDGRLTVDFGANDYALAVALQPDGKVVVAGSTDAGSADFALARLLPDGGLDGTFSTDGKVTYNFGAVDRAAGVAVQPDGRVVTVGTTSVVANGGLAVLRLTPTGLLDPSFGGGASQVTLQPGPGYFANGVTLTTAGRIVVAGAARASAAAPSEFVVARLIGTVEEGHHLVVGGPATGVATVYAPVPGTLGYNPTPATGLGPFGAVPASVRAAVADVDADGIQDTVLVTGPGTPIRLAVVSGRDNTTLLVPAFDPFGGGFSGGGFVTAGDIDNDGRAEFVVTPDRGGGPRTTVFTLLPAGLTVRADFFGIADPEFRGGARPAVGDLDGDEFADLVVAAGFGGGPRVALYTGRDLFGTRAKLANDFFVFEDVLRNGVFVAAGDVDGDGFDDLVVGAGPGGGPRVMVLSGARIAAVGPAAAVTTPLHNFFVAGTDRDRGGVRVATKDVDGDNRAEVVVGTGDGQLSRFRVYPGLAFTTPGEPTLFQDLDPYNQTFPNGVFVG